MKRFIVGLFCGAVLTASTTIYASDEIQALLFPVKFQFNGASQEVGSRFSVLNYEGHTYVPLRFMAENLGAGAVYDAKTRTVSVVSEPKDAGDVQRSIWAAKYRLERGMHQKEVKAELGDPSFLTLIESSKQQVWRYDFGAKEDYQNGGLNADVEGIRRGDLKAQLFINWNSNGQVDRYEMWSSTNAGNGTSNVSSYIVYPDGSTSEVLSAE
ncbi:MULTISPECIES: stalk domain-containing protein [unclassified Paenibacillus]|uniref:stalk domain-containing protein n=1 Tax=unclassified Paenibacillus TaxID=185978 RepID=UPI001AE57C24|nr:MULTISPECIES: stalk domain-containing protein [unclassified Paenibacillus]MBP1153811.1 hypothetical protein [Paenibacillus sp. PvP091]MBP1170804.1 hypothetical protein [Paenibacillus sp. PvR098]MBP2441832.1 hypothetical protein [Paenibacillus sp. PvP052]